MPTSVLHEQIDNARRKARQAAEDTGPIDQDQPGTQFATDIVILIKIVDLFRPCVLTAAAFRLKNIINDRTAALG